MKIEQAKKSDFAKVFALWKRAELTNAGIKRERVEYGLLIERNPNLCLVVHEGNAIIGTVFGAFNGRRAWIYHLVVDPKYRGKGIGTKLVKHVEKNLQRAGVTKIILGVGIDNLSTVPFYEKCGYKVMHDAVLFAKDLYKVH